MVIKIEGIKVGSIAHDLHPFKVQARNLLYGFNQIIFNKSVGAVSKNHSAPSIIGLTGSRPLKNVNCCIFMFSRPLITEPVKQPATKDEKRVRVFFPGAGEIDFDILPDPSRIFGHEKDPIGQGHGLVYIVGDK